MGIMGVSILWASNLILNRSHRIQNLEKEINQVTYPLDKIPRGVNTITVTTNAILEILT